MGWINHRGHVVGVVDHVLEYLADNAVHRTFRQIGPERVAEDVDGHESVGGLYLRVCLAEELPERLGFGSIGRYVLEYRVARLLRGRVGREAHIIVLDLVEAEGKYFFS